jgi:hypothetical protein
LAEETEETASNKHERPGVEHFGCLLEQGLGVGFGAFDLSDLGDLVTLKNIVNLQLTRADPRQHTCSTISTAAPLESPNLSIFRAEASVIVGSWCVYEEYPVS